LPGQNLGLELSIESADGTAAIEISAHYEAIVRQADTTKPAIRLIGFTRPIVTIDFFCLHLQAIRVWPSIVSFALVKLLTHNSSADSYSVTEAV